MNSLLGESLWKGVWNGLAMGPAAVLGMWVAFAAPRGILADCGSTEELSSESSTIHYARELIILDDRSRPAVYAAGGAVTALGPGNDSLLNWNADADIRRHLLRARGQKGHGWKRWSSAELVRKFGLFNVYRVRYYAVPAKALPKGGHIEPWRQRIRRA